MKLITALTYAFGLFIFLLGLDQVERHAPWWISTTVCVVGFIVFLIGCLLHHHLNQRIYGNSKYELDRERWEK